MVPNDGNELPSEQTCLICGETEDVYDELCRECALNAMEALSLE